MITVSGIRRAAVAALLAAAVAACSGDPSGPEASGDDASAAGDAGERSGDRSGEPSAPAETDAESAAVSHIHGVGVDPADGTLYVATHEGVLAADESDPASWRRVGDRADYMGFTVIGPGHFLGSGHPEPGSAEPSHRGLLESTDAGETWRSRSLAGTADFHALRYAHRTVYGYDSVTGTLRISEDHETWRDGARLSLLDIAVDPEDPRTVLATTADGVATSTDGGLTFGPGDGTVQMYLSWPEPGALFGVDEHGTLRARDDGGSWTELGRVPGGRPQALTAVDAEHLVAATGTGVYESRDGGRTFTVRLAVP